MRACDRFLRAVEGLKFHALEVEFDEIDARQGQGIDRDFLDRDGLAGGIVDGWPMNSVSARGRSSRLPKFEGRK